MNLRIASTLVATGLIYCAVLASVARLSVDPSPESSHPAPPKKATPEVKNLRGVRISGSDEKLIRELEESVRGGTVQFRSREEWPSRPIRPGERPQTLPPYFRSGEPGLPAGSPSPWDPKDAPSS